MSDFLVRRPVGSPYVPRRPRAGRGERGPRGAVAGAAPRRGRAFVSLDLTLLAAAAFADSKVRQRAFLFSSGFPAGRCPFAPDSSPRCPLLLPFAVMVEVPRAGRGWSRPPVRTAAGRAVVAFSLSSLQRCLLSAFYHFRLTNGWRVCETLGCDRAVSFPLFTCLGSLATVEIENASLSAGLGGGSSLDSPPTCVVIQGSFSNPERGPGEHLGTPTTPLFFYLRSSWSW